MRPSTCAWAPQLRCAGERALASVRLRLDGDETASNTINWLARAVERAGLGRAVETEPWVATALGRHLLDQLRAELVGIWEQEAPRTDPVTVVAVLRAVETVRTALETDATAEFVARLAAPNGLDLVVEVAHDLRSPLAAILLLADTLSKGQSGEINEQQRRQLRLMYGAALGLSSMAGDVLELARGATHGEEAAPTPFSVAELLESVTDMIQPIAEEKGLAVRVSGPEPDQRLGAPLALSRVLLNLTTNALKFTDTGYVDITSRAVDRTTVEFAVRDTGAGITPEALGTLYEPFRAGAPRQGRTSRRFSGTGLGLLMCRRTVEGMGSRLHCESRPGWGTRFSFATTLPAVAHR